jgi:hypothetical protein
MSQLYGMLKNPAIGKIWPAISRPYFLSSLTEVSHAVWRGAPLEMNGELKKMLKVQTVSKVEVRYARGFRRPPIEEEHKI